jgi:phage terminase small subunit
LPLTRKQQRFIEEYLKDSNGTQAAIRAGYSKKTAKEQAARLLTKVNVKETLNKSIQKQSDKAEVTVERIVNGLIEIAESGKMESAKVNAFAFLGKWLGMHKDKGDSATTIVLNTPTVIKEKPSGK